MMQDDENMESQQAEQQEHASGEEPVEPNEQQQDLNAQSVESKYEIPPQLQQAYERIVLAGMKVMFDPKTHEMALQQFEGDGPIEERLSNGIKNLMALLFKQSNNTMPPQLVIPSATTLYMQAADFLKKSGEPMDNAQLSEGLTLTITKILEMFGADPAKIQQVVGGGVDQQAAVDKAGQSGIIGGAMQ